MLSCLLFLNFVFAADPITVNENNSAVDLIEKDRTMEAQQLLQRSVVDHADKGEFHYNLAVTFEKNGNPDKAIAEYQAALKLAQDPDLKFKSAFNIASIYGEKKDVPQALQNYQAALEYNPDSVEAKTNIELLMKQGGGGGSGGQSKGQGNQDEQSEGQGEKEQENKQPNQGQQVQNRRPQPQRFESKELSQQDVKKIFEEVQRQDDKIRGKILEKKPRRSKVGKDW